MGTDIGANILVSAGTISESTVMLSVRCLEQWNLHFTVIYLSAGQQKKAIGFSKKSTGACVFVFFPLLLVPIN